jgi:predicted acyltransferase
VADIVFPLFLFVVGASMALSMAKRPPTLGKVVRRAALLFAIGVGMNALPPTVVGEVRIMGVLQRIGLAYLLASMLVLYVPRRRQWLIAGGVLLGYWLLVSQWPIRPDLSLPGLVDRFLLGTKHVYKNGAYDPEGLFSTPMAMISALAGYWAVDWLRQRSDAVMAVRRMAMAGAGLVAVGQAWHFLLPINKRLWTSSFVVLMAGWGLLLLAAVHWWIEVRRHRRNWSGWRLEVFGKNALAVFIGSEIVTNYLKRWGWRPWVYGHLFSPAFGFLLGSLLYGLAITALWWVVSYELWRRRLFIKV